MSDHGRDRHGRGRHGGGRWNDWGFFGFPYGGYPFGLGQQYGLAQQYAPAPAPQCTPVIANYGNTQVLACAEAVRASAPVVTMGQDPAYYGGAGALALPPGLTAPLGFRSRKVRGHKTRRVVACAEQAFQATGLFIPRRVAKHFEIKSIRVGGICLLNECGPIPAEYFSNDGCGIPGPIQFPPIFPGQRIEMRVKNHDDDSHTFRAVMSGVFIY